PTDDQWACLNGRALEALDSIKGTTAISTNAFIELVRRLGQVQATSANTSKQKMATTIVGLLAALEGWAAADLPNVSLSSSCRDAADPKAIAFGLQLEVDPPVRLFFPAGGVLRPLPPDELAAQNNAADELAPVPVLQPAAGDQMAQVLALLQGQAASLAALQTGQDRAAAQLTTLSGETEGLAVKVNRMGNTFEQEIARLEGRLKHLERTDKQVRLQTVGVPPPPTQNGTSLSEPVLSDDVPAATRALIQSLNSNHPARKSSKLFTSALSIEPPPLKDYLPADLLSAWEDEEVLVPDAGSIRLQSRRLPIRSRKQLFEALDCFLQIWVAAGKVSLGRMGDYTRLLQNSPHLSIYSLVSVHESFILHIQSADPPSFELAGPNLADLMMHLWLAPGQSVAPPVAGMDRKG
ncbi:MAG: hypothetical protein GY835_19515, partial [bacterium]|nr:hypothetical protein [bacterium]